jgi:hypothetical protein
VSLERDLTRLARAIDAVLIAGHAQRHWLRPDHPPFRSADAGDRGHDDTDLLAAAVRHYGGPSAALDLWSLCRAVEKLSLAWTGAPPPAAQPESVAPVGEPSP